MSNTLTQATVLIVDDELVVRSWIRTALANLDCEVLDEVADGTQAVMKYARLHPDIIFLDIDMPGKNGLDTLQEILHMNPDAFVVMVSAHSTFDNVRLAIEHGAAGFIVKPFTISKFKMLVEKFLNGSVTS